MSYLFDDDKTAIPLWGGVITDLKRGTIKFRYASETGEIETIQGQSSLEKRIHISYMYGEKVYIPISARIYMYEDAREKIVASITAIDPREDGTYINLRLFNITTAPVNFRGVFIGGISIT